MMKRYQIFLFLLFVFAFLIRFFAISQGRVYYWFDQSRDAIISSQIIEKHDLKLQGPSASGTNDTIYHGVLYYYLLAPLYTIFNGDPQMVSYVFAIMGASIVFSSYLIGRDVFKSRETGLVLGFLMSVSCDHIQSSTWLSNPAIASVTIPFFFWLLWMVFWKGKKWSLLLIALVLGITNQLLFFTAYLFFSILIAWLFARKNKHEWLTYRNIFSSTIIYLGMISSMIVTELLMVKNKILTIDSIKHISSTGSMDFIEKIFNIAALIVKKASGSIISNHVFISGIILIISVLIVFRLWNAAQKKWWIASISAPIIFLIFYYRNSSHTFVSYELLLLLPISSLLILIKNKVKYGSLGLIILLTVYSYIQLSALAINFNSGIHAYGTQQRTFLRDQIKLVDKTYEIANGDVFSFSAQTNPWGINSTWSSLYGWYGKKKYGYSPNFWGPTQLNLVSEGLLDEVDRPDELHFTIVEPDLQIPDMVLQPFLYEQDDKAGTPSATLYFGSTMLEIRDKNTN